MESELAALLTRSRVTVRVRPDARTTTVTKIVNEVIHLDVNAPAQEGKANKAVERYLAKHSGKKATVVTGATSKTKTVRLD